MTLGRLAWRLWRFRPWVAAAGTVGWIVFFGFPFFVGLVLRAVFDRLSGGATATADVYGLVALLAAVEVSSLVFMFGSWVTWMRTWFIMSTLLRVNMLQGVFHGRGAASERLPGSPGDLVTRCRDDVEDVIWYVDVHLDVAGSVVFAALSLAVMAGIEPVMTGVAVVPLVLVVVANQVLTGRIRAYRRAYREATAGVAGFVGNLFSSVLAVKGAGAEGRVLARFEAANVDRRHAAVRDQVATEALFAFNGWSVELGVGLVLLLAAPAMRRGDFTVGDLALFTTYVEALAGLPRRLGRLLAYRRQGGVAVDRMANVVDGDRARLAAWHPVHLKEAPPRAQVAPRPEEPFERLAARGLTVRHPGTGRGIDGVGLDVRRGTVTVVTGEVGAGKTTLLRGLLGLVAVDGGSIEWNGRTVDDPGTFLVPPRAAYVPQVPRLFSESLGDNLLLGLPVADVDLDRAMALAVLDDDVAAMEDGLGTLLGAGGVRLSGGQQQRAAAARALVRDAELLVVDDPSSALDVGTEEAMWERLLGEGGRTLLIVSHRPAVLARADHVVVLDEGRVVAAGSFDELAETPALRRTLGLGDLGDGGLAASARSS